MWVSKDVDTDCQRVLCQRGSHHVFCDLFRKHSALANIGDPLGFLQCLGLEQALQLLFACQASANMFCVRHQAVEEIPRTDVDISGTPCQDWSSAGARAGILGERFYIFCD